MIANPITSEVSYDGLWNIPLPHLVSNRMELTLNLEKKLLSGNAMTSPGTSFPH